MIDGRYEEYPAELPIHEASREEIARAHAFAAQERHSSRFIAPHEMQSSDELARAHAQAVIMGGAHALAATVDRGPSAKTAPFRDVKF